MNEMSINGIYAKGYADGYENGRMSKEPVFFPPCEDCNKKMDEVRKAYDRRNAQISDSIAELEKLKAKITACTQQEEGEVPACINYGIKLSTEIVEKHIAELKGENNE